MTFNLLGIGIQMVTKLRSRKMETVWMYCKECKHFDSDGTGLCSGAPFDYEILDGKLPCEHYEYKEQENG